MKTQTFGTEIEVNRISRQAAARAIAGVLSTDGYTAEVRHEGGSYDAWVVIDREGRRWKCVSDASIPVLLVCWLSWHSTSFIDGGREPNVSPVGCPVLPEVR